MNKMPLGSKGLGIGRVAQKKNRAKGKHDVTDSVNTCSCLEPACIATFKTIEEVDEHMDTGHHDFDSREGDHIRQRTCT